MPPYTTIDILYMYSTKILCEKGKRVCLYKISCNYLKIKNRLRTREYRSIAHNTKNI